jgi:hypothetical protein
MKEYLPVSLLDEQGNALDGHKKQLATREELQSYDRMLPGTTITISKVNGVWPGAPTTRADTVIVWKGPEPSPPTVGFRTLGQAGMLNNVDIRMVV